jgi:hypothetical protein
VVLQILEHHATDRSGSLFGASLDDRRRIIDEHELNVRRVLTDHDELDTLPEHFGRPRSDPIAGKALVTTRLTTSGVLSISPRNWTSPWRPSSARATEIFILDVSSPTKARYLTARLMSPA